jgi:hypothetical protein
VVLLDVIPEEKNRKSINLMLLQEKGKVLSDTKTNFYV